MNESRGNWYLITGVIIGLALGLVYAWVLSPIKYVDTEPASLANSYKDSYRRVIALAYQSDHNLERARARLKLLDHASSVQELAAQAQRMIAAKQPAQEARALALLAADLGKPPEAAAQPGGTAIAAMEKTATPEPSPFATMAVDQAIHTPTIPLPTATPTVTITPTITLTPVPTFTQRPVATMVPTLSAPFILKTRQSICNNTIRPGLLQIDVTGADGKPMPGVRIQVTWQDGQDTFYTGLAPEIDPGYADYLMSPGVTYTMKVGDAGSNVSGLAIPDCNGALKLKFEQSSTQN